MHSTAFIPALQIEFFVLGDGWARDPGIVWVRLSFFCDFVFDLTTEQATKDKDTNQHNRQGDDLDKVKTIAG